MLRRLNTRDGYARRADCPLRLYVNGSLIAVAKVRATGWMRQTSVRTHAWRCTTLALKFSSGDPWDKRVIRRLAPSDGCSLDGLASCQKTKKVMGVARWV